MSSQTRRPGWNQGPTEQESTDMLTIEDWRTARDALGEPGEVAL